MRQFLTPKILVLATALLLTGWLLGALTSSGHKTSDPSTSAGEATIWTCSMHPQVQQPKPGKCPICAMDLIPLSKSGGKAERPREIAMSESARKLADITTVPVQRRFVEAQTRMVGKVAFAETNLKTVAAYFPSRIDRLYVDYTGIEVKQGDHLAKVYSPDLLAAQAELISAIKFNSNVSAAREKLRLWGLSENRIRAIESSGETSDRMDIDSPLGGIVVTKHVNQGDYVKTGEPFFTIADLSSVWIQLDAYETDVPWLRFGQPVTFEAEAVPGKIFEGTISFISPVVDPVTRTIKVRVNADNPGLILKPDMFVRATAKATLAGEGRVIAPDLADKWISPMHPEIVRDAPGECPICGMALVKAEDLGYSILEDGEEPPLIIPASSVLRTGKRSVVYLEIPDRDQPTYEGREILTGPRAGDYYIVKEGLMEGDLVVTEGNFKIDSSLQILAKPSMMNPEGDGGAGGHNHGTSPMRISHSGIKTYEVGQVFHQLLEGVFADYLGIQEALANDSLEKAQTHSSGLLKALSKVDMAVLDEEAHIAWMGYLAPIRGSAELVREARNLDQARLGFEPLSRVIIDLTRSFQANPGDSAVEAYCPMAFDNKGAPWLQLGTEIRNPYFGAKMLQCGEIRSTLTEVVKSYDAGEGFRAQVGGLLEDYFGIWKALSADDVKVAQEQAQALQASYGALDMTLLEKDVHEAWMALHDELNPAVASMAEASEIQSLRVAFEPLSIALTRAVKSFHPTGPKAVFVAHCPMAFDFRGASWLQPSEELLNPYFGAEMLTCGSIKGNILTTPQSKGSPSHQHTNH